MSHGLPSRRSSPRRGERYRSIVSRVRYHSFALATTGIITCARVGHAARPSARVEYVVDAFGAQCPDESAMRAAVAVRLGYDPFVSSPGLIISARVIRVGSELRGELQIRDGEAHLLGSRELVSKQEDCDELAQSMAFAMAIAIDPALDTRPRPVAAASPASASAGISGSAPAPDERNEVEAASAPIGSGAPGSNAPARGRLGLGADAAAGPLPAFAWGLVGHGALRWPRVSLEFDAEGYLPRSVEASSAGSGSSAPTRVTSWLLLGTVAACLHRDPW